MITPFYEIKEAIERDIESIMRLATFKERISEIYTILQNNVVDCDEELMGTLKRAYVEDNQVVPQEVSSDKHLEKALKLIYYYNCLEIKD